VGTNKEWEPCRSHTTYAILKSMSNKVVSADNQQERLEKKIHPWYITGFVEGEGTFHIALYRDPRMKFGIKIIPEFHVSQSYLRINTLQEIQRYFECGYIKENHKNRIKDVTYVYVVRDRNDLQKKIIPFFRHYPLLSDKMKSFELFAKVVSLMAQTSRLSKGQVQKIIKTAYRMNNNGSYRKVAMDVLLQTLKSSETICRNSV